MIAQLLTILLFIFMTCAAKLSTEHRSQIDQYEVRLQQAPTDAHMHFSFGEFLTHLDEKQLYEKALYHLKKATELEPCNLQWRFVLATFCCRIGHIADSLDAYKAILQKNPSLMQVLYNAGFVFKVAGNTDTAIAIYKKILAMQPEYEQAHLGLAFSYLTKGDYKAGWKENLWNLKKQGKYSQKLHSFILNNTLSGKRILLTPEGGLGDTIHFLRYAQRLHQMGAEIILATQKPLLQLLSSCNYIGTLIALGAQLPHYDARATLMSLPTLFQDDEDHIPQNIPYITASKKRVSYWKNYLQQDTNFKIGICWQPDVHNDVSRLPIARRGIPLSSFYLLGSTPGISVYSLQKNEGLGQLNQLPSHVTIHTFDSSFDVAHGSFVDTAAIMQSMDLIISTDTATAHLAGAMGRRVWLLLPFNVDWRWLLNRNDTPWYPTMRIFKQTRPFDWDSVINELHTTLFNEVITQQK